jgi:hypothetical protein
LRTSKIKNLAIEGSEVVLAFESNDAGLKKVSSFV